MCTSSVYIFTVYFHCAPPTCVYPLEILQWASVALNRGAPWLAVDIHENAFKFEWALPQSDSPIDNWLCLRCSYSRMHDGRIFASKIAIIDHNRFVTAAQQFTMIYPSAPDRSLCFQNSISPNASRMLIATLKSPYWRHRIEIAALKSPHKNRTAGFRAAPECIESAKPELESIRSKVFAWNYLLESCWFTW